MKQRKIGILSNINPKDRKGSSGTIFKISETLEKLGYEIIWIEVKINIVFKIFNKLNNLKNRFFSKKDFFHQSKLSALLINLFIDKKIINSVDLIFAPFSSTALYYLKTEKKIIYLSDATFAAMLDYYPEFSNLTQKSIREGNLIEKTAMNKASAIILSSDWAKDSAIKDYGIKEEKINVIEFGANLDEDDIQINKAKKSGELNMLFLGVDWERKGGAIALDACKYINNNGLKCTLNIVGIKNLDCNIESLDYLNNIGFLNKNDKSQYGKLIETIQYCDCLLLPTKAECSAIAFAESSAFGLPIFSHHTGGISNYVEDGINGYLLALGSSGNDFGDKIIDCYNSGELEQMSAKAIDLYQSKLNWAVWGKRTKEVLDQMS